MTDPDLTTDIIPVTDPCPVTDPDTDSVTDPYTDLLILTDHGTDPALNNPQTVKNVF